MDTPDPPQSPPSDKGTCPGFQCAGTREVGHIYSKLSTFNDFAQDAEGGLFNKSLIERIRSTDGRSPSISPLTSESSSPFASPPHESDRELERWRPLIIPRLYVFLVKILQGHRRKGIMYSYRSVVAGKIALDHPIYHRAGINTFNEYMDLAEKAGIVELGGGKDAWVRLLPDWYDAVPY